MPAATAKRTRIGTAEAARAGLSVLSVSNKPTLSLVYAAAVQFMNVGSLELWPGHRVLAKLAVCSERTVERHMDVLVANGLLQRISRGNRYRNTVYKLGPTVLDRLKRESEDS